MRLSQFCMGRCRMKTHQQPSYVLLAMLWATGHKTFDELQRLQEFCSPVVGQSVRLLKTPVSADKKCVSKPAQVVIHANQKSHKNKTERPKSAGLPVLS